MFFRPGGGSEAANATLPNRRRAFPVGLRTAPWPRRRGASYQLEPLQPPPLAVQVRVLPERLLWAIWNVRPFWDFATTT